MTAAEQQQKLIEDQDRLRTLRQFVSLLGGMSGTDQTLAGTDYAAVNAPGQFTSVGPYSTSVEGQPILTYSAQSGMTVSPLLVLVGLGLAVYFMSK